MAGDAHGAKGGDAPSSKKKSSEGEGKAKPKAKPSGHGDSSTGHSSDHKPSASDHQGGHVTKKPAGTDLHGAMKASQKKLEQSVQGTKRAAHEQTKRPEAESKAGNGGHDGSKSGKVGSKFDISSFINATKKAVESAEKALIHPPSEAHKSGAEKLTREQRAHLGKYKDPETQVTHKYDKHGRETETDIPGGKQTKNHYEGDSDKPSKVLSLDEHHRVTDIVTAKGQHTHLEYAANIDGKPHCTSMKVERTNPNGGGSQVEWQVSADKERTIHVSENGEVRVRSKQKSQDGKSLDVDEQYNDDGTKTTLTSFHGHRLAKELSIPGQKGEQKVHSIEYHYSAPLAEKMDPHTKCQSVEKNDKGQIVHQYQFNNLSDTEHWKPATQTDVHYETNGNTKSVTYDLTTGRKNAVSETDVTFEIKENSKIQKAITYDLSSDGTRKSAVYEADSRQETHGTVTTLTTESFDLRHGKVPLTSSKRTLDSANGSSTDEEYRYADGKIVAKDFARKSVTATGETSVVTTAVRESKVLQHKEADFNSDGKPVSLKTEMDGHHYEFKFDKDGTVERKNGSAVVLKDGKELSVSGLKEEDAKKVAEEIKHLSTDAARYMSDVHVQFDVRAKVKEEARPSETVADDKANQDAAAERAKKGEKEFIDATGTQFKCDDKGRITDQTKGNVHVHITYGDDSLHAQTIEVKPPVTEGGGFYYADSNQQLEIDQKTGATSITRFNAKGYKVWDEHYAPGENAPSKGTYSYSDNSGFPTTDPDKIDPNQKVRYQVVNKDGKTSDYYEFENGKNKQFPPESAAQHVHFDATTGKAVEITLRSPGQQGPEVTTTYSLKDGKVVQAAQNGQVVPNLSAEQAGSIEKFADQMQKSCNPDKPETKPQELSEDDKQRLKSVAEQLRYEAGYSSTLKYASGDKVENILKGLTQAEINEVRTQYANEYSGASLEHDLSACYAFTGSGQDRLKELLYKDDDTDTAIRIHRCLAEHGEWTTTNWSINTDMRLTMNHLNSEQWTAARKKYREMYGEEMTIAISSNEKVPQEFRDALPLYLKGVDRLTVDDKLKMAQIALNAKNIDMFKDVMSGSDDDVRSKFMSSGGEDHLRAAFGSGSDYSAAHSAALDGVNRISEEIAINTGTTSTNRDGVYSAIDKMTDKERYQYREGKKLANSDPASLTDEQKSSLHFYQTLHGQLESSVMSAEVLGLEDRINVKGGGLVFQISQGQGHIYNTGAQDQLSKFENMSEKQWQDLHDYIKGSNGAAHPEYRQQLLKTLSEEKGFRIGDDEVNKIMTLFDKKMGADTFVDSRVSGQRDVIDKLQAERGWINNDRSAALKAIAQMSPEEQQHFREDPKYREQVYDQLQHFIQYGNQDAYDQASRMLSMYQDDVHGVFGQLRKVNSMNLRTSDLAKISQDIATRQAAIDKMPQGTAREKAQKELDAQPTNFKSLETQISQMKPGEARDNAERMMRQLADGKSPDMEDSMAKLAGIRSQWSADARQTINVMEEGFKYDPKLLKRVQNPLTADDRALSDKYTELAKHSLSINPDWSYSNWNQYGKSLMESSDGRLGLGKKIEMQTGYFSTDCVGILNDIANARPDELKQLQNEHSALRQQLNQVVASGLFQGDAGDISNNAPYQQVLDNVIKTGKVEAEDKLRSYIVNTGCSSNIMELLHDTPPQELDALAAAYSKKYGRDLRTDLNEKLGKSEAADVNEMYYKPSSAEDLFRHARDQYLDSRSGFGSAVTDFFNVGTGHQLDESVRHITTILAQSKETGKPLSPHQEEMLREHLQSAVDSFHQDLTNFKASKSAAAEYAGQAVMAALTVAGAVLTAGSSLAAESLVALEAAEAAGETEEVVELTFLARCALSARTVIPGIQKAVNFCQSAGGNALINTGLQMSIEGNDSDGNVLRDMLNGAVQGKMMEIGGPLAFGKAIQLGEGTAAFAAHDAVGILFEKEGLGLTNVLVKGESKQVFEQTLKTEFGTTIRGIMVQGGHEIPPEALTGAAGKALTAALRHEVVSSGEHNIERAVQQRLEELATQRFGADAVNLIKRDAESNALKELGLGAKIFPKSMVEKEVEARVQHALAAKIMEKTGGQLSECIGAAGKAQCTNFLKGLVEFGGENTHVLARYARALGMAAGGGLFGGTGSGFLEGLENWDHNKSFDQNMAAMGEHIVGGIQSAIVGAMTMHPMAMGSHMAMEQLTHANIESPKYSVRNGAVERVILPGHDNCFSFSPALVHTPEGPYALAEEGRLRGKWTTIENSAPKAVSQLTVEGHVAHALGIPSEGWYSLPGGVREAVTPEGMVARIGPSGHLEVAANRAKLERVPLLEHLSATRKLIGQLENELKSGKIDEAKANGIKSKLESERMNVQELRAQLWPVEVAQEKLKIAESVLAKNQTAESEQSVKRAQTDLQLAQIKQKALSEQALRSFQSDKEIGLLQVKLQEAREHGGSPSLIAHLETDIEFARVKASGEREAQRARQNFESATVEAMLDPTKTHLVEEAQKRLQAVEINSARNLDKIDTPEQRVAKEEFRLATEHLEKVKNTASANISETEKRVHVEIQSLSDRLASSTLNHEEEIALKSQLTSAKSELAATRAQEEANYNSALAKVTEANGKVEAARLRHVADVRVSDAERLYQFEPTAEHESALSRAKQQAELLRLAADSHAQLSAAESLASQERANALVDLAHAHMKLMTNPTDLNLHDVVEVANREVQAAVSKIQLQRVARIDSDIEIERRRAQIEIGSAELEVNHAAKSLAEVDSALATDPDNHALLEQKQRLEAQITQSEDVVADARARASANEWKLVAHREQALLESERLKATFAEARLHETNEELQNSKRESDVIHVAEATVKVEKAQHELSEQTAKVLSAQLKLAQVKVAMFEHQVSTGNERIASLRERLELLLEPSGLNNLRETARRQDESLSALQGAYAEQAKALDNSLQVLNFQEERQNARQHELLSQQMFLTATESRLSRTPDMEPAAVKSVQDAQLSIQKELMEFRHQAQEMLVFKRHIEEQIAAAGSLDRGERMRREAELDTVYGDIERFDSRLQLTRPSEEVAGEGSHFSINRPDLNEQSAGARSERVAMAGEASPRTSRYSDGDSLRYSGDQITHESFRIKRGTTGLGLQVYRPDGVAVSGREEHGREIFDLGAGKTLVKDKSDGSIEYREVKQGNVRVTPVWADIAKESELAENSLDALSTSQRKQTLKHMREFMRRGAADGLPPHEIAMALHEFRALLSFEGVVAISDPKQRTFLARQAIMQAAHPEAIEQGNNNTCSLLVCENLIYRQSPSQAIRMLKEVATTGQFVCADGTKIDLSADRALTPDAEASTFSPTGVAYLKFPGKRTFASQIAQLTLANIHWSRAFSGEYSERVTRAYNNDMRAEILKTVNAERHRAGQPPLRDIQVRYELVSPKDGERLAVYEVKDGHLGARITELKDQAGNAVKTPAMSGSFVQELYNQFTGRDASGHMLAFVPPGDGAHPMSETRNWENVAGFSNAEQLHRLLTDSKPVAIVVHNSHQPFKMDNPGGSSEHWVVIREYDPTTRTVTIENQYGENKCRRIALETLYAATQGPRESTGRFKQLHDWIRAHTKEGVRKRSVFETTKTARVVSDGSVSDNGERSPMAGEDAVARIRSGRFEKIISRQPAAAPDESISSEAERQRRTIEIENRISEPLEDGVRVSTRIGAQDVNGVPYKSARSYSEHGDFNVVVDLTNDPTIRNAVKEISENPHLSQLGADKPWSDKHSELVGYLNDVAGYVRSSMEPVGVPTKEQQEWYQQLTKQWTGEQVLLGQFVDQKMGICNQQALMAKVLLDYTIGGIPGAEVSFERGDRVVLNEHGQEMREPHAWVRVRVPEAGGFRDIIVDPRRMTPLSESTLESASSKTVDAGYPRYDVEPRAEKTTAKASEPMLDGLQIPQARFVVEGEHGTTFDAGSRDRESGILDPSFLADGNANYSASRGLRLHVEQDGRILEPPAPTDTTQTRPERAESKSFTENQSERERLQEQASHKESDESGRPVIDGNFERVAAQFEPLHESERRAARAELERDMSEYKGSGGRNILQQLSGTETLTPSQREMILSVLTEVRERYMSVRDSKGAISPEQRGSYIHTIGELSETLDSAKANGLSGQETMNAALAAMLSDSSKAGWTRESGGNFFTHHLDGALAAEVVLKRYLGDNFTHEDLNAITHSILEHQIGPPSFMAFAYTSQIRSQINEHAQKRLSGLLEQERDGKLSVETHAELQSLNDLKGAYEKRDLAIKALEASRAATPDDPSLSEKINALRARQKEGVFVTDAEAAALANIHKMISNPFGSETEPDSMGGVRLKFDNLERTLLYKYIGHGTENWHVPDATNSWDRVSRVVISADSFDNYYPRAENGVPVKGPFKIAGLRGPLSVTPDNHIDAAIASLKDSEQSTLKQGLLTPADVERAKVRMQDDDMIYSDAKARTEAWIREELHLAPDVPLPDVPYWNSKLKLPGASASVEEKAAFAARPEVQFADRIQKQFTNELLRMRRFSDDVPQSFESVRGSRETQLNHRAEAAQKDAALLSFQQFIDANVLSDRAWGEIGKSLDQFNERARLTDMSAETFNQCLERVRNILQPNENSAIDLQVRQSIAEEALWLLANPTFTAQGTHSTCGPASIEARHYQIDPANALKVVEDIAIRGEYICPDGTILRPFTSGDKFEFTRDKDASTMWREGMPQELEDEVSTTRGGRRLAVSQIFQTGVLAAAYHNEDFYEGERVGAGNLGVLSDQVVDPTEPTRLRDIMVDMSKNPPVPLRNMKGQIKEFIGLHNRDLLSAYKKLFGKEDLTIIQKGGARSGLPGEQFFSNEAEFFDIIQKTKFPAILNFDTVSSDRFWQGGHGGGHYIGIVDKESIGQHIGEPSPETMGLRIDNQWQPDGQTVIPLTELATMSFSRWDIKRQSMVRERIASHPDDIEAKLELVRLRLETERQRRNNEQRCAELQAQGKPIPKVIEEFRQTVKPDENCISADEARKLIFELKRDALIRNRKGSLEVEKESQLWDGSSLADALAGHEELRLRRFINRANKVLERAKLVEDVPPSATHSAQESGASARFLSGAHADSDETLPIANGAHETSDGPTHLNSSVDEESTDDGDPFERFASLLASVSSSHRETDDANEEPKINYTESGTVREQLGLEPLNDRHEHEEHSDTRQQGTREQDFSERLNQFLRNEEISENIRRSLSAMQPQEQMRFLDFIEGRPNLESAYQEHTRLEALRRERLFPALDAGDGGRSYPGKWTFPDLAELGDTGLENLLKRRLNDFENHPFNHPATMERFHDHIISVLPRWLPEVNARMMRLKTELTPLEHESQTIEKRLTSLHDEMLKSDLAFREGTQRFSTERLVALQGEMVQLNDRLAVLDKQTDPLRSELVPLVERRRQMLEESLNAFALEQGLPSVRLRVDKPLPEDATATYDSGTGDIYLRERDLCEPDRINIGVLYHELLHGEQDAAVLRNAMLDAWRATGAKGDLDEFYAFGRAQVFKFYKEALNRRFVDVQLSPERFSEVFPVAQDANKLREYEEFVSALRAANPSDTNLTNALAHLPTEKQLRYRELHRAVQMQALHDRQINWINERAALTDESLLADPEYARARHLADSLKPELALNPEMERFSEIDKIITDSNHNFAPHEFVERLINDPAYQEKLFGYQLLDAKFADSEFQELLFTKQNFAQKVLTYKFEQWANSLSEEERPRFAKARIRLMLKALVFMHDEDVAAGREFDNPRTVEMTKKLLTEALHDAGDGESRRKWKDYLSNNWEFEANLAGNRLNHLFDDRIARQLQAKYPETGTRDYYTNLIERYQENKNPLVDGMTPQQLITEYERVLHEKYELDRVAKLDDMTGLPNKAGIREHLEHEIKVVERKRSTDTSVSFLMMDFDGFKPVNDNLGHDFGDRTIKAFGEFLKTKLKTSDIPGRFGGDEFVAILPNTLDPTPVVERIRQTRLQVSTSGVKVLEPDAIPERGADVFVVGVSVGFATWGKDSIDPTKETSRAEQLMKIADDRQLADKNERKALARQGLSPQSNSDLSAALDEALHSHVRVRDVVGRSMPSKELSADVNDLAALREIVKRGRARNSELIQTLIHDPLTGLYNKAEIERCLHRTVKRYERLADANEKAGLPAPKLKQMMMDVDGLKPINDTFGHIGGDLLLRTLAARMQGYVLNERGELVKASSETPTESATKVTGFRDTDVLARLGGDEFMAILPDCEDVTRLAKELQDYRVAVGQKDNQVYIRELRPGEELQAGELMSGISIGYSDWVPGRSAKELEKISDDELNRNKELREELGLRIPRPKEVDRSGRVLEKKNPIRVADQFKPLTELETQVARAELRRDMSEYKGADGKSVLEQVRENESLTSHQKEMILNVLAEVRERYVSIRDKDGAINPEQRGSYLHTIGELSETLDSAKANGLDGRETQNAALAAMLSDSSKAGWSPESGGNFFTHHLDGALAAEAVLSRYLDSNFTNEDLSDITHAILEHQIGPPRFMADRYTELIRSGLSKRKEELYTRLEPMRGQLPLYLERELERLTKLKNDFEWRENLIDTALSRINAGEPVYGIDLKSLQAKQREGKFVSDEDASSIENIRKMMADPLASELEKDPLGGYRLKFSAKERSLLARYVDVGTENWHVPNAANRWDKISRVVISADSFDNYFPKVENGEPVKGPFKIAALRGPDKFPPDNCLDSAIAALKESEINTLRQKLLTPVDEARAAERMKNDEIVYARAHAGTEKWLRETLGLAEEQEMPSVPYWNCKLDLPRPSAPQSEKDEFFARPDVKLAIEIQRHFAGELLAMRRFDQSQPTDFRSVRDKSEDELEQRKREAIN